MDLIVSLALSAMCLMAAPGYAQTPTIGREVGQAFPDYVLPGLDGKRAISLSQFRGKKLILIEFASW
jgi:hypothetical protein